MSGGRFVYANQAFAQRSELAVFGNWKIAGGGSGSTRSFRRFIGS